jgi:hypothetical protein
MKHLSILDFRFSILASFAGPKSSNSNAFQAGQGRLAEEGEAAVPLDTGAPGVFGFKRAERLDLYSTVF